MAAPTSLQIGGYDNYVEQATITAPTAGGDSSPDNLKTVDLSLLWNSPAYASTFVFLPEDRAYLKFYLDSLKEDVRLFTLVNHNLNSVAFVGSPTGSLSSPTCNYRLRMLDSDMTLRVRPTSIVATSNYTGTISALEDEDPWHPDAVSLVPTVTGINTSARIRFPNPSFAPLKVPDLGAPVNFPQYQAFVLSVGKVGTGTDPVLTIRLAQNGVNLATLATGLTVSDAEQVYTFTWSGPQVTGTGAGTANVEVVVEGTGSGTAGVKINSVLWVVELQSGNGLTLVDTGLKLVGLPKNYRRQDYSSLSIVETFDEPQSVRTAWVDLVDPAKQYGYVSAGYAIISPKTDLSIAKDAWNLRWGSNSVIHTMKHGNIRTRLRRRFRICTVSLVPKLWDSMLNLHFDKIDRRYGKEYPLFWIFGTDPLQYPNTAFLARITETDGLSSLQRFGRRDLTVQEWI